MASFDIAGSRSRFPAMNQDLVFMDNAGKFIACLSINASTDESQEEAKC